MSFIRSFIRQSLLVNLLSIFIVVAGAMVVVQMKRQAFPDFSFDIVVIRTAFPGSSPEEIERLVTIPIEDELRGVSDIEQIDSSSIEGLSIIVIEIDPDAKDSDRVVNNIQRAVDRVDDLPDDAENPIVTEILTGEQAIIQVGVGGDLSEQELQEHSKALEDRFLDVDGVGSIDRSGWRDREIWIETDPEKLQRYHLSMQEVAEAIREHSLNLPAGTSKTSDQEWLVRTVGELDRAEQYNDIIVRSDPDGHMVRIRDIGVARDGFLDDELLYKVKGKPAIILRVIKSRSGDTINIVNEINQIIKEYRQSAGDRVLITTFDDQSFYIQRRLKVLVNNGWLGIGLVLLCLIGFLHWRIASLTAVGIPIAFFLTFLAMQALGISINLISMFGLIIVLGMIVDDAIIIAENSYRYIEKGMGPREAAVAGTREVIRPVTVTILTTIASFLPLMFMTGIFGKFVWQIPMVVILALTASLLEAFFVLPSHVADFAKAADRPKHDSLRSHWFDPFARLYERTIKTALRLRYVVVIAATLILAGALTFAFTKMRFILFPGEGIEFFFVRAKLPNGTPMESTAKAMEPIEAFLDELPEHELDNYVTVVGIQQGDPTDPFTKRGTHLAQIVVYLTPPQDRQREADDIIAALKKKADKIDGFETITFERVRPGPPVGKPVAVLVKGEDYAVLEEVAARFRAELESIDGIVGVDDDYEPGKREKQIIIYQEVAKRASLSVASIASAVRRVFAGEVATTIRNTDEEIDVLVRFPESIRNDPNALAKLQIRNPTGNLIPFSKVATVKEVPGVNAIKHRDWKRVLTVTAEILEDQTTAIKVNRQLEKLLPEVEKDYPEVIVQLGGEFEDTAESLASLRKAFMLSALLIFFILTTLFRSLARPFIVMAAIPFGLIGVVIAFQVHNLPLSFMCMLGVIGLSGVVVNDSIILVDFIRQLRLKGTNAMQSIIEGCQLRLRPVILTTITTLVGLIPVAYGIGGLDPFLRPAALAVSWGLAFATSIILIVIPCLHAIQDDCHVFFLRGVRRIRAKWQQRKSK